MPTLFNPRATLPAYPTWKAELQIQRRALLPGREIVQRAVYICGPANPSPAMLFNARNAAMHAYRLVATGWSVLVSDDGIASEVIKTCRAYNIPYEKISSPQQAVRKATKIVIFDRPDILTQAYKLKIPCWFNGLTIPIPTQLPLPF